ncbi:MAG: hypothetical protein IPO91_25255 [Chloroflexi bacterium]|nr:hypothetical protein [Chloroflexota bacterium]
MSFSNALYYPYIDIKDKGFIVNIALFWEAVSTIVPRGYREPYSIYESKALADAYILRPLYVEPGMSEVLEAENAALEFLESPATSLILSPKTKAHISSRWDPEETKSLLYPDKMSRKLVEQLVERGQARWQQNQLITSSRFSTFYMTLLAAILSRRQRLALLTGEEKFDQLSSAVKRGDAPTGIPNDDHLAAGLLAYLTIDALKVDPETPIDKIITFRRQYSDELTEFRNGVNELASEIGTGHESIKGFTGTHQIHPCTSYYSCHK